MLVLLGQATLDVEEHITTQTGFLTSQDEDDT